MNERLFQVRVTGVLIENNRVLLVKQRVSEDRGWSLPGGKLEAGETLQKGIKREIHEETGLVVEPKKLLYICDGMEGLPLLHITFLLERISGSIRLPSNELDQNPISAVEMVPLEDLRAYGLSELFMELALEGFPNAGNYMGHKRNIGL